SGALKIIGDHQRLAAFAEVEQLPRGILLSARRTVEVRDIHHWLLKERLKPSSIKPAFPGRNLRRPVAGVTFDSANSSIGRFSWQTAKQSLFLSRVRRPP